MIYYNKDHKFPLSIDIRRLFRMFTRVYTRDCPKNGECKIEEQGRRNLLGRRTFPRKRIHYRSSRWIYGGSRAFYTLAFLPASRERNYLIITLNARLRPRESIYRRRRRWGSDLYRAGVREGPEDDDGIYYGLVCVFKRQSPSPVRTTAIWSAGVAIDYR